MQNGQDIKFSVVIPVYNAGDNFKATIESCLNQSYPPHEIIIVEDGSEQNVSELVNIYNDSRIVYIQLISNNGVSIARNKGMDRATGDYIAFLDHDDIWHHNKLLFVKNVLEAKPDIDFLFHSYTLDDINKVAIPEGGTLYKMPFIRFLGSNPAATPCVVIRNNPEFRFEPDMRYMEDYDLWLRIAYKHRAFFINIPLTQLGRPILSAGGASSNKWKMRRGELKAYRRLRKLNPLFILLLPILYTGSIGKHLVKKIKK